ncbi:MAG: hypothetical protein SCK70_00905 [bacterium]|nr:hypothetical protein [bacterium]
MKRWVKKILAKYVNYVEIVGYGFVLLFIAGLIALSFIKAEDEFVALEGVFQIKFQMLTFNRSHYLVEQIANTNQKVIAGQPLIRVTDDEDFIANQRIKIHLDEQMRIAESAGKTQLLQRLESIRSELTENRIASGKGEVIRSRLDGEFLLFESDSRIIEAQIPCGGVFDFQGSMIRVTTFPPDKRLVRKLKIGQQGSASIHLTSPHAVTVRVKLDAIDDSEAQFSLIELSQSQKNEIAMFFATHPEQTELKTSLKILVGYKSWMRLIWR